MKSVRNLFPVLPHKRNCMEIQEMAHLFFYPHVCISGVLIKSLWTCKATIQLFVEQNTLFRENKPSQGVLLCFKVFCSASVEVNDILHQPVNCPFIIVSNKMRKFLFQIGFCGRHIGLHWTIRAWKTPSKKIIFPYIFQEHKCFSYVHLLSCFGSLWC